MGQVITTHSVILLEMADHRLDRGSASEVSYDLRCNAALLTGGVDFEPMLRRRIGPISGIGDDALNGAADQLLRSRDDTGT
jgi:hypothetical protein